MNDLDDLNRQLRNIHNRFEAASKEYDREKRVIDSQLATLSQRIHQLERSAEPTPYERVEIITELVQANIATLNPEVQLVILNQLARLQAELGDDDQEEAL